MADFEKEVIRGAGTRYAPFWPEILKNEKLREELEYEKKLIDINNRSIDNDCGISFNGMWKIRRE